MLVCNEGSKGLLQHLLILGGIVIVSRVGEGQDGRVVAAVQLIHSAGRNQFIL